jgi:hypothetical protein
MNNSYDHSNKSDIEDRALEKTNVASIGIDTRIIFACKDVRECMMTLDNIDDKKNVLFATMKILAPMQVKHFEDLYESLSAEEKHKFIEMTIRDGIFIIDNSSKDDAMITNAINEIHAKIKDFEYSENLI